MLTSTTKISITMIIAMMKMMMTIKTTITMMMMMTMMLINYDDGENAKHNDDNDDATICIIKTTVTVTSQLFLTDLVIRPVWCGVLYMVYIAVADGVVINVDPSVPAH
jgi:hypothetical protein